MFFVLTVINTSMTFFFLSTRSALGQEYLPTYDVRAMEAAAADVSSEQDGFESPVAARPTLVWQLWDAVESGLQRTGSQDRITYPFFSSSCAEKNFTQFRRPTDNNIEKRKTKKMWEEKRKKSK